MRPLAKRYRISLETWSGLKKIWRRENDAIDS
jgi:hypothetical protein